MNLRTLTSKISGSPIRQSHVTATGGGRIARSIGVVGIVVFASALIASVLLEPNKRNIEILAGVLFAGIVLVAHPHRALLFTLFVVPFPAYTSVGSTSTLLILALAILVVVKSRELNLPSPFQNKRIDIPLFAYFLMTVLSLYEVPSEHLGDALTRLLSLLSAITLFYVIILLADTRKRYFEILGATTAVSIPLYLIALMQYLAPNRSILPEFFRFSKKVASMEDVREGYVRVFATFPGYETFAEYTVLTLLLNYLMFRRARTVNSKLMRLTFLVLSLAALFATGTRAGLILLAVGWVCLFVYGRWSIPRQDLFKMLFVAIALFYLSLPFFGDYYALMFTRMGDLSEGAADSSVQARIKVLSSALTEVSHKPLLGHGFVQIPGRFRGWVGMNIHNLYATIAYEVGIPALLFYLSFMTGIFLDAYRTARDRRLTQEMRVVLAFMLTLVTMFVVDQMKIEFTRDPLTMHTTFTFLALAVAATRISRKEMGAG